jgi:5'-nucleotidase
LPTRLHVIHTNDFHSQFDRWPQTVTVIRSLIEEIEQKNEPYLLVDIGDHLDRSHPITEGSMGLANIELMNQVGYHYSTIGNNEGITFPKEELHKTFEKALFKVLVNNVFEKDGSTPKWLSPYKIHEIEGKKIALIGTTIYFNLFYELLGWSSKDPFEAVKEDVAHLKSKVDFVIILSHLGHHNDERLAMEVEGIDLILGGHTHQVFDHGLQVKKSFINHAGKAGQHVGHVVVEWGEGLPSISSRCINTTEKPKDNDAVILLNKWEKEVEHILSERVAFLDQEIEAVWDDESLFGNLLAESLSNWCNTPISLVNSGQILTNLQQGNVTRGDFLRVCPHPINPCIVHILGDELWQILQLSLDTELQKRRIRGFGFRGEQLGTLALDGLQVTFQEKLNGKEILHIHTQGKPLQMDSEYAVATIDMFTFSNIFSPLYQREKTTYLLPEFLRDILISRFQQGNIKSGLNKRWIQSES